MQLCKASCPGFIVTLGRHADMGSNGIEDIASTPTGYQEE